MVYHCVGQSLRVISAGHCDVALDSDCLVAHYQGDHHDLHKRSAEVRRIEDLMNVRDCTPVIAQAFAIA